jgi:glycine dehydrogenase subunit 2
MSVDTHFYPLGSCTMKYNPKRNERLASLPGCSICTPISPRSSLQGMLAIAVRVAGDARGDRRLPAVSLQPAAGAHGELTALMVAAAYFRDHRRSRGRRCWHPDSAHGTNPASARWPAFRP